MMRVLNKVTLNMEANILHWQHKGKYWPNSKVNATIAALLDINPMIYKRRIRKKSTTDKETEKTTLTVTIKREEKMGQDFMETSIGAESMGHHKSNC